MRPGYGFSALNVSQSFGAANDNILKQLLIFGLASGGIWADQLGEGAQAYASLSLALPFVLFSGYAGQYSDRYSKRNVIISTKLAEILVALTAFLGLWLGSLWIVLGAMVLLALQSTFFSPAKFGILPEMIPETLLSRANGTMNMFTYSAVILGSALGGPLYDAYAPDLSVTPGAVAMPWLPGVIILVVAGIGVASSWGLPILPAQNPSLKIRFILFEAYQETWREIRGGPLASVIIAWCFFYFIVGGIAILILPDYKDLLNITATSTAILMAILGIATGVGDFVAGRLSGHGIRPGLIPVGAGGATVAFFALGLIPDDYITIACCLAFAGFMGGFLMVPLQTLTQHLATKEQRGRVLGLWNCGSFLSIIAGNLVFLAFKQLGAASTSIFLLCGVLNAILLGLYYLRWQAMFLAASTVKEDTESPNSPSS